MDEWRQTLRRVVAGWTDLSPEEQAGIVDELETHLEQQLAEWRPQIGEAAALARIVAQVNDPALRRASVQPWRRPPASVDYAREYATGWRSIGRDFRYGWRALRANPATTIPATIALALGIGLTAVMFSILYGVLLRGLPFATGDRIAMVMEVRASRGHEELPLSIHDFAAYRDGQRSFELFGGFGPATINLSGDDRPERVTAARVAAATLALTRVHPILGRVFRADDEAPGAASVVVLSHLLWDDRYAGDSSIIGRAVRLNGQPATVIGVLPDGFNFPHDARLWVPLRTDPGAVPWGSGPRLNGVALLRPGVTFAQANADLARIASRLEAEHPQTNEGIRPVVQPFVRAVVPARVYALMYTMFGAVALVFLIACANVANLLLARAIHRAREAAVRVALGASRWAVARQFLVEALVLSLVAAAVGALIAEAGIVAFRGAAGGQLPFWSDVRLDPAIFLFIVLSAIAASAVSGLLPALSAARRDIADVLKDQTLGSSSHGRGRLGRALVIFELALSGMLFVVAALATKSVVNLRSIEPGFRADGVMTGRITLSIRDSARQTGFMERLEEETERLPGAVASSLSSGLPGSGWHEGWAVIEGATEARPTRAPNIRQLAVTPGFFKTYDIPVTRGRAIGPGDRAGTLPIVVVNQRFVDQFFPSADPLGRRINLAPTDTVPRWVTIVGIIPNLYAADPRSAMLNNPWPAEVLTAFRQAPQANASIAVHTRGDPTTVARPLRAVVASLDRDLPVYSLASMTSVLGDTRSEVRIFGGLFVVFGVVALALSSIGLYAVLAFSVSRRERELGIRLALGAAGADVVRLVFRDGALQLAVGGAIGLALGIKGAGLARAVLFGVRPTDTSMIAVVIAILAATGFAACVVPAMRAAKSDPVRSLRAE